jgi:hypothetical protein
MPSIIIEKEDFEFNCLYKTIWDSYPGIGYIGGKIIFIKIKLTQLFPYLFFFIKYSKTTH